MARKLKEVAEAYKFSAPLIKVVPSIIHPTMHPEEDTNVKVVNTYKDISILVIAFVFFKHCTMCHYIYMLLKEIQAFALHNSFNFGSSILVLSTIVLKYSHGDNSFLVKLDILSCNNI